MVNDLKTLIIQQIRDVFNTKVYDEPIKQGLETPAFLVLIISDSQTRKLWRVSERDYLVNVTYFPEDERNSYTERDSVSQLFKDNFRYIGDRFLVNRLEAEKHDGALVITFTVRHLVKEVISSDTMERLQFGGVSSE